MDEENKLESTSVKERSPRLDSKPVERKRCLKIYSEIIDLCRTRIHNEDNQNKLKWVRCLGNIMACATNLMRDSDLGDIKSRISALEEQRKKEPWSPTLIKKKSSGGDDDK